MESAFDDLDDLRRSVDGALFVGPPNSTRLWRTVQDRRDPCTTEVLPTYAGGLVVRFAATRQDLAGSDTDALHTATGPWTPPRMLYLQHRLRSACVVGSCASDFAAGLAVRNARF